MVIEIPDEYLEPMREMPVVSRNGKYKSIKDGGVIAWIRQTDKLCVPIVMAYKAMLARADELGMIKYNPDTDTWQGVDCNGR